MFMGRVVVMYGVAGVGVAVGRDLVGVDVGGRGVGVEVGRLLVGVATTVVSPDFASSVATLFSKAASSFLLAFVLDSVETLRFRVAIRLDRPSRVSPDCAYSCEKPNTNRTTTTIPIPTVLRFNIAVPPW